MNNFNYEEALKLDVFGSKLQLDIFNFAFANKRYKMLAKLAEKSGISPKVAILFSTLSNPSYLTKVLQHNSYALKCEKDIVNNISKISTIEVLLTENLLSLDSISNRVLEINNLNFLVKYLKYARANSSLKDKVFQRYVGLALVEGSRLDFEKIGSQYDFMESGYVLNNSYNEFNYYTVENLARAVASREEYYSFWKHIMSGMNRTSFEIFSKQSIKLVKEKIRAGNNARTRNDLNSIAYIIENVISKYGFDDLSVKLMRDFFKALGGDNYEVRYLTTFYYSVGHGASFKALDFEDYSYEDSVANTLESIMSASRFDYNYFQMILRPLKTRSKRSVPSNDVPMIIANFINKIKPNMEEFSEIIRLIDGYRMSNEALVNLFDNEKYIGYYLALAPYNNYGILNLVENRELVLSAHKEMTTSQPYSKGLYFLDLTSGILTDEEILGFKASYLSTSFNYRKLVERFAKEREFDAMANEIYLALESDFLGDFNSLLIASKNL